MENPLLLKVTMLLQSKIHTKPLLAYSADLSIPLTQPFNLALRALCLRSWPADWTVSLDLTVSSRRYNGFSAAFDLSSPT